MESSNTALEECKRASKTMKSRVKEAMKAKLAENDELQQRVDDLEREAEQLRNTGVRGELKQWYFC